MARIVFMGTPAFALPALRVLLQEGHQVAAVVTRPDRPAGRSREPLPSPVKRFALEQGLYVWQPEHLRGEAVERLRALGPEVIIVAAYGELLRPEALAIPPHGCLNLHASLLPRWRGASPVAAAILAGDRETGVTLMLMDAGMDSGPMLAQEAVALDGQERSGELSAHLAEVGAGLLRRMLPDWLSGQVIPQPQDESRATYCPVLRKEDGGVDWTWPATQIARMVRAYDPWPGAYTTLRGRRLRLWQVRALPETVRRPAGTLLVRAGELRVATGEGLLLLEEVQLEGKRRVSARDFLLGQRDLEGIRLGGSGRPARGRGQG